ncbi:MAG: restriction endonuclease [Chloroflexaceae bacterium]|nr:restriction endonuclease [Chloroflexaceae bacterium]
MDFIDRIREISARIPKQLEHIQTEEATKHSLIMPFISALGYNVFDPTEVTPELHADVGVKKGEKVDYAILRDGKPIILMECKWHGCNLAQEHASQLYRYFSVTAARFAILTNGIQYWFYTDLDAPNKMDAKPFFEFDLLAIRDEDVRELKKFTRSTFDLDGILNTASELKYTREIKRILADQITQPAEDFVKFFASQVYTGRMTQTVREQFAEFTKRAFRQFINEQINTRLQTVLESNGDVPLETNQPEETVEDEKGGSVTTEEELEGYLIIKAILRETVNVKRIMMRDQQSYCGIILDDNNRKPICRLWFNRSKKYIGLFDQEKKEERILIEKVDDIYGYAERLKATVALYEQQSS